jgi:hypothetical protein
MLAALASTLRLITIAICLVTIASYGLFAVNQTDSASARQQHSLASEGAEEPQAAAGAEKKSEKKASGVRGVLDEVAKGLASPFESITASSNSEWGKRSLDTLLVLLAYGFGLGFLARFLRVRA